MALTPTRHKPRLLAAVLLVATPGMALSATDDEIQALKREVEQLKQELHEMKALIKTQGQQAAKKQDVAKLEKQVRQVNHQQDEWKQTNSVMHVAGYADISYTDAKHDNGAFNQARFNPIFHFQYKDLLLLEAEAEIAAAEDGSTEFNLEYATMDLFASDNVTLFGGKFLSPVGYFRPNLHPSWINRFPSMPVGFGEGVAAAPTADVGVGLRGGFSAGKRGHWNYVAYVGNGPQLESDGSVVEQIASEGYTADADGHKVVGGRIGYLPIPHLEFGVSAAGGKAAVTNDASAGALSGEPTRNYRALGVDAAYQRKKLRLRGEYIQQKIDNAAGATYGAQGGTWKAWYVQGAYRFLPSKWEGVVRYGKFNSPIASQDQKQWGVGLNYLFGPNVMAKLGYEFNQGEAGTAADNNRLLLQLSYGF